MSLIAIKNGNGEVGGTGLAIGGLVTGVLGSLTGGIAVVAIFIGLLLPAVQKVREAAARMQSSNNLKQIAIAIHNHESAYSHLPPGIDAKNFSALMHLLPFIEQDNLYKNIDRTRGPDSDENAPIRGTRIKTLENPRDTVDLPDPKAGPTNYMMIAGSKADLEDNDGIIM